MARGWKNPSPGLQQRGEKLRLQVRKPHDHPGRGRAALQLDTFWPESGRDLFEACPLAGERVINHLINFLNRQFGNVRNLIHEELSRP